VDLDAAWLAHERGPCRGGQRLSVGLAGRSDRFVADRDLIDGGERARQPSPATES
jgi:hypothetical protein